MTDTNKDARNRIAKALREYQMAGRMTVEWDKVPKGQRKKWHDLADVALNAADLANPLAALVMRERAADVIDQANANGPYQAIAAAPVIRALPLPCTDAELLAAAAKLMLNARFAQSQKTVAAFLSGPANPTAFDFSSSVEAALRAIEGGV